MEHTLEKANIDNLTGLWRLMGATESGNGLQQSISWPRRCWLGWDHRQDSMPLDLARNVPAGYLCPIWAAGEETAAQEASLLAAGFEMGLQQLAMVLPLVQNPLLPETPSLSLHLIENESDSAAWSDLCGRAFGYQIDADVIEQLRQQPGVEVLWAVREGEPVATAILYQTESVAGVHQVAVPPEQQGRGIARELMQWLIARARAKGAEHVCLQASAAGEPLYRSMGFQPQFTIRSYRRA